MTTGNSHKEKLKGLYAITDQQLITEENFHASVEATLQGGTRIIQYRDKSDKQNKRLQQAGLLRALCHQYHAICIINDDIELARAVNAHGVHLGKDDLSLTVARQILGENAIIGVSCYNDLDKAIAAENNKADYVAFGAIFSSTTKPEANVAGLDIITKAKQQLSIPVCTIGGITQENIRQVIQQGADMAAVISGIFSADDIKQSTTALSQFFN
ncbi:MAG: thiamine phosphate synthase [Gammaproteobacteria bacterium]|nr:thiamine phosphate synthase [Gammaproteobacteria bacterium]